MDYQTEFERDIRDLMANPDIQCRSEICEAEYNKARNLLRNRPSEEDIKRAYGLMNALAVQLGYVPAMMWLADFYEFSLKDLATAVKWYKAAADEGDPNGARCYADMRINGFGIEANEAEALQYYQYAAEHGIPDAMFVIAEFLRIDGKRQEALDMYQKAYNCGFEQAMVRIEQMKSGER